MSTGTSPTRSTKDMDTSKTPDKAEKSDKLSEKLEKLERKVIPMDQKLENRLNMKDLERLQDAFMAEGDGYDNKLSLTKDQFCEALSLLLNKGAREEYGDLFDKVDVTREGIVDWDKFASHMLLEFYEKDDRVKSTQVPQWKDLKTLPSPHKEVIQRIAFLTNTNRYIGISKEGCISLWGLDLKLQRALKTGTDSCKARDLWVTHFVPLQNLNKIALAITSKEIAIYDMSSKNDFNCQYKVQGLSSTPLCLDYWFNPRNTNEAIVVWGDVSGFINALFFSSANIALFERPAAPAREKQEPCLNVQLSDVVAGKYKNAIFTKYEAHKGEWVRQVKYSYNLGCFISCATAHSYSVVIGWMEKHTAVNPTMKQTQVLSKDIQRTSTFQVTQGINAFDFNGHLNLIATAGVNHHVCLWNPYVVSKPNGVLRGHMASVVQVQFIKGRGQLISFSKDKVLRIWDVQLQVCIQRLAGMFPKGPEVQSMLYFDEGKDRNGLERNRLFISFNYQLTLMEMKAEIRDRIMSHEKPVVAAIYNSVYNQIVSVCQSGTIIVWMIDTGQKVKQFNNVHGNSEVTCLSQDPNETRLFTGSTDGTVKVWDFNGHCYHTLECSGGQPADVGQILHLKRSVVVVGWAKYVTIFRHTSFREFHVQPADWKGGQEHAEDILSVSFVAPNILASGSYDGEIVVWNTNSEQASRHMNQRSRRKLVKSRGRGTFVTTSREPTQVPDPASGRPKSRPRSRALSRVSEGSNDEQNEYGWAVARLLFLEARKSSSAGAGANLVSCGGNGWVRFWNTSHNALESEFIAHSHAGSIIMATDKQNQYLVTGDVDGNVKVWDISEYCVHHVDETINRAPPLKTQFQPHSDMINTLEICERNERLIIVSASSDCSVALWDVYGNHIGVLGQEEHWKIDPLLPVEEPEEEDNEEQQEEEKELEIEPDDDSQWEPDERAVADPMGFRINTWDRTVLGKNYQEMRVQKRERRQPGLIEDLPYLHWERTGAPPAGPYSALDTLELDEVDDLQKPDNEKYFIQRRASHENIPKLPALSETLKTAFDEKTLFPKYILDFESKMKNYHTLSLNQQQSKAKAQKLNLTSIGLQMGQPRQGGMRSPSKTKVKLKPIASRRSSVTSSS